MANQIPTPTLSIEIFSQSDALSALKQELDRKTTELNQKTEAYNLLVAENNRQKITIEANEKLIAELRAENEQLKVEIATIKEKYNALERKYNALENKYNVLENKYNVIENKIKEQDRKQFSINLITAIQDLNATDRLEDKFNNPTKKEMKKIRDERNRTNHYTCIDDIDENTMKYRYSILKQKMENMSIEDIDYFNITARSHTLHEKILEYLTEKYSENYIVSEYESKSAQYWWN